MSDTYASVDNRHPKLKYSKTNKVKQALITNMSKD